MPLNIFEGARRISKLGTVLWIVGVLFVTLTLSDPYITATYTISASDGRPVLSDPSCIYNSNNHREVIELNTKKGTEVHGTLCFSTKMKDFVVTSPDGDKFSVTAPEVATEQQIWTYVQTEQKQSPSFTTEEQREFKARFEKERALAAKQPSGRSDYPLVSKRPAWMNDPIVVEDFDSHSSLTRPELLQLRGPINLVLKYLGWVR